MQIEITPKKLKTIARRLAEDLSLDEHQRRRTLDSLARSLGHKTYARLEAAAAANAPADPDDKPATPETPVAQLRAVLGPVIDRTGAMAPEEQAEAEMLASRFLRACNKAVCVYGSGDVAALIERREGSEDCDAETRGATWMARYGHRLEEHISEEAWLVLADLLDMYPAPAGDARLQDDEWVVALRVEPARDNLPAQGAATQVSPDTALPTPTDPDATSAITQRHYWTIVRAETTQEAIEAAQDAFHASIPLAHPELVAVRATAARSRFAIQEDACYLAGAVPADRAARVRAALPH
ncbi:hypothetical protein CKO28_00580 [Rhodovibrio sodomensis]|uniref:Uncharacterized protein n=1 Tax=Rhodovibrio sodomensis TaxID=1088 RepID=A0ABS1D989_9PROT|nr:hypothetical protein [Rhodovibrio sodomensis]MBK1666536.1 hypothetical protein [Rhodovibrio sodomensis]